MNTMNETIIAMLDQLTLEEKKDVLDWLTANIEQSEDD